MQIEKQLFQAANKTRGAMDAATAMRNVDEFKGCGVDVINPCNQAEGA